MPRAGRRDRGKEHEIGDEGRDPRPGGDPDELVVRALDPEAANERGSILREHPIEIRIEHERKGLWTRAEERALERDRGADTPQIDMHPYRPVHHVRATEDSVNDPLGRRSEDRDREESDRDECGRDHGGDEASLRDPGRAPARRHGHRNDPADECQIAAPTEGQAESDHRDREDDTDRRAHPRSSSGPQPDAHDDRKVEVRSDVVGLPHARDRPIVGRARPERVETEVLGDGVHGDHTADDQVRGHERTQALRRPQGQTCQEEGGDVEEHGEEPLVLERLTDDALTEVRRGER